MNHDKPAGTLAESSTLPVLHGSFQTNARGGRMTTAAHDLLVIGAGPGGYVAAIRAAQLGLDVACVDKEELLGGTCLRVGCIPSKALLESSEHFLTTQEGLKEHGILVGDVALDLPTLMKRKDRIVKLLTGGIDGLFKKNKIRRYQGTARFISPEVVEIDGPEPVEIRAKHVIIATGSVPAGLPGITFKGRIGTSTEALAYPEIPGHLVVIGAGYIGLELGSVWARLGSKVTVVEYLDRILPGMDSGIAAIALRVLKRQGLSFKLSTKVLSARQDGDTCIVEVEGAAPISCDQVLVAVGRAPNTAGLGLDAAGIAVDAKGRIPVDAAFRTVAPGVFAIGDVIGGAMLAHKAHEEGIACVEGIVTGHGHVNYDVIPGVCFIDPEVASVGRTEDDLKAAGIAYRTGSFPFRANGRAMTLGRTDGEVKVLADAATDRILGVHIIGPRAGDLIAEAATAMEFAASAEDLARTCHAHPTLPEAIKEAALAALGRAIHA
jgi:dihydrolipoamide dehydrogenase